MKIFYVLWFLFGAVSANTYYSEQDWKIKFSEELNNLKARVELLENSNSECQKIIFKNNGDEFKIKIEDPGNHGILPTSENKTLEERVEYLEELEKVNTLRSCEEYSILAKCPLTLVSN